MILSIWDEVTKVADNFKEWIIKNSTNPVLWVALFFIGIFIFVTTYRALNKQK